MDICKAPTLQLKALNKHSITHIIMYIEMKMLSTIKMYIIYYNKKKEKKLPHNVDKGTSITMQKMHTHTHTHTHTLYRLIGVMDNAA